MNFKDLLICHIDMYPKMNSDDALKAAYQSIFGAAHFRASEDEARSSIEKELSAYAESEESPATTEIGDYSRLELKNPDVRSLGSSAIAKMFIYSAERNRLITDSEKKAEVFGKCLSIIDDCIKSGELAPGKLDIEKLRQEKNPSAPSHSEEYKRLYHPSYRVVSQRYLRALPLLFKIKEHTELRGHCVVGIDGPCASGKSTIADFLSFVLGAPVIHMDSFFLPPQRKTEARLAEAGGNVDYERFAAEVAPHLRAGKDFRYNIYSCQKHTLTSCKIPAYSVIIVEGVYSMRKEFQSLYDIKTFCDVDPDEQIKRLTHRSPAVLDRFIKEWIPMENNYFDALDIRESCDVTIL